VLGTLRTTTALVWVFM